jgi:hypothetical protein
MDSNQRKCSQKSAKNYAQKKMVDLFPGMQVTTLPNGKKGWADGYDLFYRTTGKEAFLDEPFLHLENIETSLDKVSEWWFKVMDQLIDLIVKECGILISDEMTIAKACKLWFCGLQFIKENHPSYLNSLQRSLMSKLSDIVEGDNFWDYNPVRVVRHILWCTSVEIALKEKTPVFPPFRVIPEENVSDQEEAIQFVAYSSRGNDRFFSLLNVLLT